MTRTWARRGAVAVAAGRTLLGVAAVLRPQLVARPWVGSAVAEREPVRVLGRALGGRDLGIGAGTLWALGAGSRSAVAWVVAGTVADGVDVLATLGAWRALPPGGRAAVAVAAGGATVLGALAAAELAQG